MKHYWRTEKIVDLDELTRVAADLKKAGKRLVTANGSFDLLHAGHLDFLEEAKQQGDVLMVGINSDASVREGKEPGRPFVPQAERAALLAALACVDYVTIIDGPYKGGVPQVLLAAVKPAVHVNGAEYGQPPEWVEWATMQQVGAAGHAVARRPNLATSDIIARVRAATL